jgi:hypothetical protein
MVLVDGLKLVFLLQSVLVTGPVQSTQRCDRIGQMGCHSHARSTFLHAASSRLVSLSHIGKVSKQSRDETAGPRVGRCGVGSSGG